VDNLLGSGMGTCDNAARVGRIATLEHVTLMPFNTRDHMRQGLGNLGAALRERLLELAVEFRCQ
jgi:hypothetical protein